MSMNTPICDFVRRYAASKALRAHMPGHKGQGSLGVEALDITEISGADSLYEASGIIAESERNASTLFGCPTWYSTEGSSQCIRAMVHLALLHAQKRGKRPLILAGRNAHRTFLSAAALLDAEVSWLVPEREASYLSCSITPDELQHALEATGATAVYVTCPDYLGNTLDLAALAQVCHSHGALLLVDNAHGAYLKFLPEFRHPMDLGADICCDSAHKTLPVLTGGAYLHLSDALAAEFGGQVKTALALFGSTSPSYLILQSLDAANAYLADGYAEKLSRFANKMRAAKERLTACGFTLAGDEELKITLLTKPYGYTGTAFAALLREKGIECEFSDPDYVVFMLTPENGNDLERLTQEILDIPQRAPIFSAPPALHLPERAMSIREATLSPQEVISALRCLGRVLAAATVGCPPAVPIAVCGERLDEETLQAFRYYGIDTCTVVCE